MISLHHLPEFLCIGHRGAMGHAPENTLKSMAMAIDLGCPWIELDVYAVEGELVVFHDDRLERTTNGSGRIADASLAYLRSLDAGDGERIPTLGEVFALCRDRAGINVELKGPGTAGLLATFLQQQYATGWAAESVLVSSFDHRALAEFRQADPHTPLGALYYGVPADNARAAQALGAFSLHPSLDFVDRALVEDAHRRGLKVFVYTVNSPEDIETMRALGVDGVFSNYPERILET